MKGPTEGLADSKGPSVTPTEQVLGGNSPAAKYTRSGVQEQTFREETNLLSHNRIKLGLLGSGAEVYGMRCSS